MNEARHAEVPRDALLAHAGWVRQLARSLVFDDQEADEVVQDTWLELLTHPPCGVRNLRRWLATAVQNRARQRARAEASRRRREAAAVPPVNEPDAATSHEVLLRQQELVKAVLALDEPYSSALVQRYFEDLQPRQIARRRGVPIDTVHTWLTRGRSKLRARLDEGHGSRRAWGLALSPLAGTSGPGSLAPAPVTLAAGLAAWLRESVQNLLGGIPMSVSIATATILLSGVGALGWRQLGPEPAPEPIATTATGAGGLDPSTTSNPTANTTSATVAARVPLNVEGGRIQLRLWNTETPPATARVRYLDASSGEGGEAITDAGGEVELPATGRYLLMVDGSTFASRACFFDVGSESIVLDLLPTATLGLLVTSRDGVPVEGVEIQLHLSAGEGKPLTPLRVPFPRGRSPGPEGPPGASPENIRSWLVVLDQWYAKADAEAPEDPVLALLDQRFDGPDFSGNTARHEANLPPGVDPATLAGQRCPSSDASGRITLRGVPYGTGRYFSIPSGHTLIDAVPEFTIDGSHTFDVTEQGPSEVRISIQQAATIVARLGSPEAELRGPAQAKLFDGVVDDNSQLTGLVLEQMGVADADGTLRFSPVAAGVKYIVAYWIESDDDQESLCLVSRRFEVTEGEVVVLEDLQPEATTPVEFLVEPQTGTGRPLKPEEVIPGSPRRLKITFDKVIPSSAHAAPPDRDLHKMLEVHVDLERSLTLRGFPAGQWSARASHPESRHGIVRGGDRLRLTFPPPDHSPTTLPGAGPWIFRPVINVAVTIPIALDPEFVDTAPQDVDWWVLFGNRTRRGGFRGGRWPVSAKLPEGEVTLLARPRDRRQTWVWVEDVTSFAGASITARPTQGVVVTGSITGDNSKAVRRAWLTLAEFPRVVIWPISVQKDGRFRVLGLPPNRDLLVQFEVQPAGSGSGLPPGGATSGVRIVRIDDLKSPAIEVRTGEPGSSLDLDLTWPTDETNE